MNGGQPITGQDLSVATPELGVPPSPPRRPAGPAATAPPADDFDSRYAAIIKERNVKSEAIRKQIRELQAKLYGMRESQSSLASSSPYMPSRRSF